VGCGLSKAHIRPEVLVSHGNARTTVHGRKLIVERHRAGWRQAHIAAAMGISRKCVRTWITRYETEGEAGLVDRSSRPAHQPDPDCRRGRRAHPRAAQPRTPGPGLARR
jgi:leucine-zipper of insertion element IS481